jgi:4-hydroxy-2-oxovalerate aldolase
MSAMKLLDTTLRDGSYVINFQFSAVETRTIAAELDAAGIELVEVGHGVGLGASGKGQGAARESDQEYMRAAAAAVKRGLWGMFCIPGIAELDDIALAADHGMPFIRIGTPIERIADGKKFIAAAKKAKMFVATNFMKSYTRSPQEFATAAQSAAEFGADIVYIVDSAGNMLPDDVERYFEATRSRTNVPIGFHAHNNLGLANANAFKALQLGSDIIDCSLQGMGRCTGNTITEQFVAILQKMGKGTQYNLFRLMDASEIYVRPLLTQIGHDSVDLVCGLAGFHSSYMSTIRDAALAHDADPRKLIIEVCKETQDTAPAKLVQAKARAIAEEDEKSGHRHRFPLRQYFGHEQNEI